MYKSSTIFAIGRPAGRAPTLALGAGAFAASVMTLMEVRFAVMAGVFNGFGRVIAEVGSAIALPNRFTIGE